MTVPCASTCWTCARSSRKRSFRPARCRLRRRFAGRGAAELAARVRGLPPLDSVVAAVLAQLLRHRDASEVSELYCDGVAYVLAQPEYTRLGPEVERRARITSLVHALEDDRVVSALVPQVRSSTGVQVLIGSEHQWGDLRDCSVVAAPYGLETSVGGIVGIVGPTRMPYARAVAMVRYMAEVITDVLGVLRVDARDEPPEMAG